VVAGTTNHIQKTKIGLVWSFLNQFGTQIITLGISILLARLIPPSEFGLLGMVTVFTAFAGIFINFGFSEVLIQKDAITKEDLDTVFFCNITISVVLYILFFSIAPLLAVFYSEPRLVLITRVVAILFLIAPLSSVKPALVSKSMDFKLSTKISLTSLISGAIVAVVMALYGFGVWSIVAQSLVSTLVSAIYYKVISDYQPVLRFHKAAFKSMIGMGSSIAGNTIVNYWTRNADNLLVGKFLGETALGIYNRAYSLMLLPLTNISRVIINVMLPSFSMIKHNKAEVKRIYLRITEMVAAITFPLMFGLSAVSGIFVLALFGNKWAGMIPILSILAIIGAIQSILTFNGSVYISQGKANIAFRVTLIFNIVFLIGIVIGLHYGGLMGIAYSYFITTIMGAVPNFYFAARLINVSVKDMYVKLIRIFIASVIMWLIVALIAHTDLIRNLHPMVALLLCVGTGIAAYAALAYFFKIKIYWHLTELVMRKVKSLSKTKLAYTSSKY